MAAAAPAVAAMAVPVGVAAAMAVVGTAAGMAVAVTLVLSVVPGPVAGRIAAMAAETALTPGEPVVAAAAAVGVIIPAPRAEPGGLEPPGFQLLGGRDQHLRSGVPPAGFLGDGISPVACSAHPLDQVHQVAGDGP